MKYILHRGLGTNLYYTLKRFVNPQTTEAGLDYSGASQSTVIPNNSTITHNTCGNMMEINCFDTFE